MDGQNGTESHIPKAFFSEWIHVFIPTTSVEATYPLPPELANAFNDYRNPPSIISFAKSVLETTARLLNSSATPPELAPYRPNRQRFHTLSKQLQEWMRPMQATHVNRADKKSRILKYSMADKCAMSLVWVGHPEWPDWPTSWPDRLIMSTPDGMKWRRWASDRRNVNLTLVK
ncbi:MAG: hypothetical protein LBT40_08315 [Deltaproteobacteria bacterium]|jgi:hypothetical protein|nr:hypothetical protein [Deltaproteobacteria bacterium]